MSNSYCSDELQCPQGNCPGCSNGQPWCQDPACSPYCRGCPMLDDHDQAVQLVTLIIASCLLVILFLVWYAWGPTMVYYFTPGTDTLIYYD